MKSGGGCRLSVLVLSLLLVFGCAGRRQAVTLLHFNDFHGQVEALSGKPGEPTGGLARLAGVVDEVRAEEARKGRPVYLLFAGDAFTGTAFSTLFQGEPEFEAFRLMGVAAMTPGNHEWDFGAGVLAKRARQAGFPLLLANVEAPEADQTFWTPCTTLQAGKRRIGIIGVITPDTPLTTAPGATAGFVFSDPARAVARVLADHRGQWDFIVVLSHCGFEEDRRIARTVPGVGLIIGGHDHKVLQAPWIEKGVPIVQAGDRGRYLGEVRVRFTAGGRPEVSGRLLPVTSESKEDPAVARLLAPWLERERRALGAVIGRLPLALSGDRELLRSREMPLGDLLADLMREASGAEVAFVNAGAIRAGLPKGGVTGIDLYACLPFFDSLNTVRLKGAQIQAILDRCAAMPLTDAPGGFLQVSGLAATFEGGKAMSIRVDGEPLAPERDYSVACTQFLLKGGDGHVEFTQGTDPRDWGISLQELMRRALAGSGVVIPSGTGRIDRPAAQAIRPAA